MSTTLPLPADGNPIQSDATLQTLLRKLDKIKKYKTFQRWKNKFLDRLTEFLYQAGMDPATKRCDHFNTLLQSFIAQAAKVTAFIEKEELCPGKKTVKAALALQEMCKQLTALVDFMRVLIPSRISEEKQCGFSKFHLGAALIRQGFHQYTTMIAMDEALLEIATRVGNVADRQQLELFDMYRLQMQRFCDVMADLHLYEVMIKCVEFADAPVEEESSDEEDIHIEITVLDSATKNTKKIKLEVDPLEKVGNIKSAIANDCGIVPDKQVLKFRGVELTDNTATLKSVGVDNHAKLTVESFKIPITVKTYDGKSIELRIDPGQVYMSDLKRMLEAESGIPGLNQRLTMQDKELDNDFLLASDYDIVANSVLQLQPKAFAVTVKMPDGTVHALDVTVSDTPATIKEKIQVKTGMPIHKQVLKHQQAKLPDGKTVGELGIREGAVLDVEIFQVPVTVKFWDGRSVKVMVDPTWHIRVLKRNLERDSGVEAENQRLFDEAQKEFVEEMKTAGEYGVKDGSVLTLEPRSFSVTVEMPDGSSHEIAISPDDTAQSIKAKIATKTGMAVPRQILKHNGKELPSDQQVRSLGIKDGSKLKVDLFTVPIAVHTYDGKIINIQADPHDTIGALKALLAPKSGLDPSNQRLSAKDEGSEFTDDNAVASEFGIGAGSELYLEPKSMKVTVELPDGSKKEIVLSPSDSVAAIKEKIAKVSGMVPPSQVLKHGGKALSNDSDTARGLGIKDGSKINVELYTVPIVVHTYEGKVVNIMANPNDTIRALKKQLEPETGLEAGNQRLTSKSDGSEYQDDTVNASTVGIVAGSVLYVEPKAMTLNVQLPDGSATTISVSPSDTVANIKEKIAQKAGLAKPRQVLKTKGKALDNDGDCIRDLGIKDGSTINVEIFTVPIVVRTYDGKTINIQADPHDKVAAIKALLEPASGLVPANQRLTFEDNQKELSDDNAIASDLGVCGGTKLYLEPKSLTVIVELPDGSTTKIALSPSDSVSDIKEKIAKQTGMKVPRQVLKCKGKTLRNDGDKVRDLGIQDGSTLNVEIFTVPVVVRTYDGKVINVRADPSAALGDLKRQLEPESGLEAKNQCLSFVAGGDLTNDGTTMAEYGIGEGSELFLAPKSIAINVTMPNGGRHSIAVSPLDTCEALKAKIEAKTGMSAPRQILKFGGKKMPNNVNAHDFGLKDGSDVVVELHTIPITVRTMDGEKISLNVEPTESLASMKEKLQQVTGIVPSNQRLSLSGKELVGDKKQVNDHGIKAGSELDLEPKSIAVKIAMPDGSQHEILVAPSDTSASIKKKIEDKSGLAAPRQVLNYAGKVFPTNGKTVRDMGVKEGAQFTVDLFKVPITVETYDGKSFDLSVEPLSSVLNLKEQIQGKTNVEPKKQCLMNGQNELTDNQRALETCGVKAGTVLFLDLHADPIIFVDVKCGTLFAMDRDEVIAKCALTPNQGNKLDFMESTKESELRDNIKKAMMGSPRLGFATQVVVEKNEVDDYDLQEAENVKAKWGVHLKKRAKNKKGEEFIFVDPKTGACGELLRQKYIDMKFITVVDTGKGGETLANAEKETMKYDKYINSMRGIFGVTVAK